MLALHIIAAASLTKLVGYCAAAAAIGGALVGLLFRAAAMAWREEKEAAVDKAVRLAEKVDEQSSQIAELERKVDTLEKRTNYETYAKRSARDHRQILESLAELSRSTHANSIAVEFLIKQAFPTAALPAAD